MPDPQTAPLDSRFTVDANKIDWVHEPANDRRQDIKIEVFSTCCSSKGADSETYLEQVIEVARWSERAGCRGILVYADNGIVDPWIVSQVILEHTEKICPLVAIQPAYMHPYAVAKMITSFAFMYQRKICLNMIAGGFRNDLFALDDQTPHDDRYDRLVEYTQIIQALCGTSSGISMEGKYYRVQNLKLTPQLPSHLQPQFMMSGSSSAGLAAATATGVTAIKYPKPGTDDVEESHPGLTSTGVRVGIIARQTKEEAWKVAEDRFPEDRKGRLTHFLAMKTSDSHWHHQLSKQKEKPDGENSPYWMRPFHTYKTFCPYLVGSYEEISREISDYVRMGHRTFILDIPPCQQELEHANSVFKLISNASK
jgi:alkanesulfonate monooxygenase